MNTTLAAPASTPTWYAGTAFSAGFTSHLLPATWERRRGGGGGRPSLCGQWRRGWQAVHLWTDPSAFTPCRDCANAAAIATPNPHPAAELPPIADPDAIHPAKMATPAKSGPKIWHLLHVIRRRRSSVTLAVCGEPRMRWREVDGTEHRPCPACVSARPGGQRPPAVRIAPAAPRDGHRPVITTSVPAVVLATQLAHAALPAGWRPGQQFVVVRVLDDDGLPIYGQIDTREGTYTPTAHHERAAAHGQHVGQIAFPDWAPLTYCTKP